MPRVRALLLAAGMLFAWAMVNSGCKSIDVTEQLFGVRLVNDTSQVVEVRLCSDASCDGFYPPPAERVPPGGKTEVAISDEDILTTWQLRDQSKRVLGCLPLAFTHKYRGVEVLMSQRVKCGSEVIIVPAHPGRRYDPDSS